MGSGLSLTGLPTIQVLSTSLPPSPTLLPALLINWLLNQESPELPSGSITCQNGLTELRETVYLLLLVYHKEYSFGCSLRQHIY